MAMVSTRWSLVLRAGAGSLGALEGLCGAYWFGRVQKQAVRLRRLGIPEDAASDLDVCPIQPAVFVNALAAPKRRNSDYLFLGAPFPVYAYLRRRGLGPEDAADQTQEFFVGLLRRNDLAKLIREGGGFAAGCLPRCGTTTSSRLTGTTR